MMILRELSLGARETFVYFSSLSPFVHVDADGSRPSSLKESMLRSETDCTSVANPHTVNNGGAYPQVALPHGSECRCDVTLERITLL